MAYDQAFWTDTYLMWELMYKNALYKLQGSAPDYDHIQVFYHNGQDYNIPEWLSERYMVAHQFPEIEKITDYTYYKDDIFQVLDWLAQGGGGIDPMTNEDNFFLYVIAHGSGEGYFGVAAGADTISNIELKEKVDAISANTKILWFQPCYSGMFTYLHGPNTVILTSTSHDKPAYCADDIEKWQPEWDPDNWEEYITEFCENELFVNAEECTLAQCHGEFSFHAQNAVRGETPTEISRNADQNNDLLVSMGEAYDHVIEWDSYQYHYSREGEKPEEPWYSDDSNIGYNLFLGWDDYTEPSAPTGLYVDAIGLYPKYAVVIFDWFDNTEQDLIGYYAYRRKGGQSWVWRGSSRESYWQDICNYNTHYWYHVTAIDVAKNESDNSKIVHVYVPQPGFMMVAGLGNPSPSPYLVQRTGYQNWGNTFEYTVDYDTEELIYRFENLDPEKFYLLALVHYAVDTSRTQALDVDGVTLLNGFSVTYKPGFDVLWIPQQVYADGEIQTNIRKVIGEDAVISEIIVAEFDTTFEIYGDGSGGGPQTSYSNTPLVYSLSLYPIPAKNDMSIRFGIPREGRVSIKIFDVSGREVQTLVDERVEAGYHIVRLDNINLPSGIYFAKLVTASYKETKKLVVMK